MYLRLGTNGFVRLAETSTTAEITAVCDSGGNIHTQFPGDRLADLACQVVTDSSSDRGVLTEDTFGKGVFQGCRLPYLHRCNRIVPARRTSTVTRVVLFHSIVPSASGDVVGMVNAPTLSRSILSFPC
jgi:hypothetical protein